MKQQMETPEQTIYLSCAETAKLVRTALKEAFPNQKFSVKSSNYSGGASINVSWDDGVAQNKVNEVIKQFEGAGFDGMIDLKFYKDHWLLPNGEVVLARSDDTEGGRYPSYKCDKPHPEAKKISFGADYVSANREISREIYEKIAKQLAKLNNIEFIGMDSYPEEFAEECSNWWNVVWRLVVNEDLTDFKEIVSSEVVAGKWEDFYKVLSKAEFNKLNKPKKKKIWNKDFEIKGKFGWKFKKHNNKEFLTLLKLYNCAKCGVEKNAKNIFSYVDGNNKAITDNAKEYCLKCYKEIYG